MEGVADIHQVRDPSSPLAPARLSHLDSSKLDLQLRKSSPSPLAATYLSNKHQIIVQITPPAISNIGWRTYIIFAVLNALWVPIIYLFFPETKGLELEDVDCLFSGEASHMDLIEKNLDEERVEKANATRIENLGHVG